MIDEDILTKINDKLGELFEKYRNDPENSWKAKIYKEQFDVLSYVLELDEAENVFDEEVLSILEGNYSVKGEDVK